MNMVTTNRAERAAGEGRRAPSWPRRLFLAVMLVLGPALSGTVRAEILVMKDGTRVPCRILSDDGESVTVRREGGTEVTYKKTEIASIDPSVSSVETYEGVAEKLPPDGGMLAYYLGLWCVEHGRKADAKDLLEAAARSPSIAGRSYLALADFAETPGERRILLTRAVLADPSLDKAIDALLADRRGPVDIPRELLGRAVELVSHLESGERDRALAALAKIEGFPDVEARQALLERLYQFTALGADEIRQRLKGAGGTEAPTPAADGSCAFCNGTGHVTCRMCEGTGFIDCRACGGDGTTTRKKRHSRRGYFSVTTQCGPCGGKGGRACTTCLRRRGGPVTRNKALVTTEACPTCQGAGTMKETETNPYTNRTRTTSVACIRCRGKGTFTRRGKPVKITIYGSGIRRCQKCNADGHIPPWGDRTPKKRRTRVPDAASQFPAFQHEEISRLSVFKENVTNAMQGRSAFGWKAGLKAPFSLSLPKGTAAAPDRSFACGRWCTSSMRDVLIKRKQALNHNPRPVDVSDFMNEVKKKELEYLRAHGTPVAARKPDARAVRSLAELHETARRWGGAGGLERSRLIYTTFKRGPRPTGDAVCRVYTSAGGLEFLLLRDTARWPSHEIGLIPVETEDMARGLRQIVGAMTFVQGDVTLWYRVTDCERRTQGRDATARVNLSMVADIRAVVVGSLTRPRLLWIRGLPGALPGK